MRVSLVIFVQKYPWACLGVMLVLLFGFQLLIILFGIDLYDTGFHLVAYENIFEAPDCVTYNFMYYLTNIVGGIILRLFPEMGVIDFCVVGAFCVLGTMAFVFALLKNEIPTIHLLLGMALVITSYARLPYSFNNGILSCCLYAIAIVLLYKGVVKDSIVLLILSGVFVGINMFTRIPNVLGLGLFFLVLLHKYYCNKQNVLDWKNAFFWGGGVCMGISFVLLVMVLLGHLGVFLHSIKVVLSMASGDGTHSLLWMLKIFVVFYLTGLISLLFLYGICQIDDKIRNRVSMPFKISFYTITALCVSLFVYNNSNVYYVSWGVFVLGCVLCMIKHKGESICVLAALALFMVVVEICGSDSGVNHGGLPAMIAAPIASAQLLNKKRMVYVLSFVIAVCLQIVRRGNYQDYGPIFQKTELINCSETRCLFTTGEKANAINNTMEGIRPYVHLGDTLMCFPAAPMMNYLTHTRPAGGMSWIGENGTFPNPIEGLPKVLFNKTNFSGESWAEVYSLESRYAFDIKNFITIHEYRKVYENEYFMLFVP